MVSDTALFHSAVDKVLGMYGVEAGDYAFIGHREKAVYHVTVQDGEAYLLRFHSPLRGIAGGVQYQEEGVRSELQWLEALHRDTSLAVPDPLRNSEGNWVSIINHPERGGNVCCTVLRWLNGEMLPITTPRTPAQSAALGTLLAQLHEHAARWTAPEGFVRPFYDSLQTIERFPALRGACHAYHIRPGDLDLLGEALDQAVETIQMLERNPQTWGLIHADLNEKNYLVEGETVKPIDFSHCGFGYFLYDLGECCLHLRPPSRRHLFEAYHRIHPLPDHWQRIVEAFFIVSIVESLCDVAPWPCERPWLEETMVTVAEHHCPRFIEKTPFLFG